MRFFVLIVLLGVFCFLPAEEDCSGPEFTKEEIQNIKQFCQSKKSKSECSKFKIGNAKLCDWRTVDDSSHCVWNGKTCKGFNNPNNSHISPTPRK